MTSVIATTSCYLFQAKLKLFTLKLSQNYSVVLYKLFLVARKAIIHALPSRLFALWMIPEVLLISKYQCVFRWQRFAKENCNTEWLTVTQKLLNDWIPFKQSQYHIVASSIGSFKLIEYILLFCLQIHATYYLQCS